MEITEEHLVFSGPHRRTRGAAQGGDNVVRRGVRLRTDLLDDQPAWRQARRAAEARVLATALAGPRDVVFAGQSALLLWNVDLWQSNPDVEVRLPCAEKGPVFPALTIGATTVPAVRQRQVWWRANGLPEEREGVMADSLVDAALIAALRLAPMQAAVAVAGAMRRLVDYRRHTPQVATRTVQTRALLTSHLAERGDRHGQLRARQLVRVVDPACETVGERALHWLLCTLLPQPPSAQLEVNAEGRQFFLDLAIPERQLAIEFDGVSKLGQTPAAFQAAKRDWVERQAIISRAGWRVLRVAWRDLLALEQLRRTLRHQLQLSPTQRGCLPWG
ncbi:hypothetical protein [Buchananella hordeovulneris]|nr:hypothetical protein [Buchananella hordeovulneris]